MRSRPGITRRTARGTPSTARSWALVSRVVSTYADAPPGDICALFGSTDHLEIAANGASAEEALALGRGASVRIARRA